MITRSLNQSYRNFSKGLDNVNDPEILKAGFTPACRNVRFDSTGVVKRGGTKKMHTTAVDAEIVSIFDFTDRRGNSLSLFIEADATVWKYNALDNKTDISASIVLSAAYSYQHGSFWKGAVDYLMLTDFTNYVKKISYTDTNGIYEVKRIDYVSGVLYTGTTGNSTTGVKSYNGLFATVGATLGVGVSCLHVVSATSMLAGCVDGHVWSLSGTTWTDRGQPNTTYIPKCCKIIGSYYYVGYDTSAHGGLWIWTGASWENDSANIDATNPIVYDIDFVSTTLIYINAYRDGLGGTFYVKTVNGVGNITVTIGPGIGVSDVNRPMRAIDATHVYFSVANAMRIYNGDTTSILFSSSQTANEYIRSFYVLSSSSIFYVTYLSSIGSKLLHWDGSNSTLLCSFPNGVEVKDIVAISASSIYISSATGLYYYD